VAECSHRSLPARAFLLFCFGLFSIAAQTLLFREFVISLEGHDISIGLFFACWFLWVALGAFAAQACRSLAERLSRGAALAVLAYIPAFVLEFILILQIRRIAGIEAYASLGLARMLVWSLIVCSPVSGLTGFLFPVLCRWLGQDTAWPITRVYVLEAAGSLVGGLGVTFLLALGVSSGLIFLILAAVLAASSAWALAGGGSLRQAVAAGLVAACAFMGLGLGLDQAITTWTHAVRWTQILPQEGFAGSFVTSQAEYLYGTYKGQWLVFRDATACEALPDVEHAGKVAALGLSQRPKASRILVVGSGLGLCQALLKFPHVRAVDWSYPDLQYVRAIRDVLPADLQISDSRFTALAQDVRTVLADRPSHYDLVIVNLASAAFNRYSSVEFLEAVKSGLQPEGLVLVTVPGSENVLGPEQVFLGASVRQTLKQVFAFGAVVPGEETFLLASPTDDVYVWPRVLRDRFDAIPGAAEVYPPDALLSVYRPDRSNQVADLYSKVQLPREALVSRDGHPTTYLYGLLLASRQAGLSLAGLAGPLLIAGIWPWLIPLVTLVALRWIFLLRHRSRSCSGEAAAGPPSSSVMFLIFSAGWVGIGSVIVLMSRVQSLYGSLYLVVGIASALFMAGLCTGAICGQALLARIEGRILLLAGLVVHAIVLAVISLQSGSGLASYGGLAAAFVAAGLCCGLYFPIAARLLAAGGQDTHAAASRLQAADHVGACVGGFLTSLVLIPVTGLQATGLVLAALVLANIPLELARTAKAASLRPARGLDPRPARIGYVVFGVAACLILGSNLLVWASQRPIEEAATVPAGLESWTAGLEVTSRTASLTTGESLTYFQVREKGRLKGYIVTSERLAPRVRGYGGPMTLAMYVDAQGTLIDYRMVRNNETPRYIGRISSWLAGLKGTRIWGEAPLEGVHAVTGATLTTRAVMTILRQSGQRFSQEVLLIKGSSVDVPAQAVDRAGLYVVVVLAAAILVTWWGGVLTRLAVLAAALIVGGLWLNSQYSTEQAMGLLAANLPSPGLTATFLLAVIVPGLLLLAGNIHCGYLCPFGAMQEWLSMAVPARLRPRVSRGAAQKARLVKYVVLLVFVAVFFLTRDKSAYGRDLLLSFFDWRSWGQWLHDAWHTKAVGILAGAGLLLLALLLFPRFWCRTLCPAGAFLSLFNYVALFSGILPPKRFGCCEFGLTVSDHLDCVHCDRCRHGPQGAIPAPASREDPSSVRIGSAVLVLSAVCLGLWMAAGAVDALPHRLPAATVAAGPVQPAAAKPETPAGARENRIKALIDQGRLSDKEAMYYDGGTQNSEPRTQKSE
jgi:predicted membrane-bound spermidine synthase